MDVNEIPEESFYPIPPRNPAEGIRLRLMHELLYGPIPDLFSPDIQLLPGSQVLDIGCGPGTWIVEGAIQHPEVHFTGIDISHAMIEYALAQSTPYANTRFLCMNARTDLAQFSPGTFNLIHIQFLFSAFSREDWMNLFSRCFGLLRPGGWLQWVEIETTNTTTSPAFETLTSLMAWAYHEHQGTFSPHGTGIGIVPVIPHLLRRAGFSITSFKAYPAETSYGMPNWKALTENMYTLFQNMEQYFVEKKMTTKDDLEALLEQFKKEAESKDFCRVSIFVRVTGRKPSASSKDLQAEQHSSPPLSCRPRRLAARRK